MRRVLFGLILCVAQSVSAQSQDEMVKPWRRHIALPWVYPQGHNQWENFKPLAEEMHKNLFEKTLGPSSPLKDNLQQPTLWKSWVEKAMVGAREVDQPMLLEPVACALGERRIIGLYGLGLGNHVVLGSAYRVLQKNEVIDVSIIEMLAEDFEKSLGSSPKKLKIRIFDIDKDAKPQLESLCLQGLLSTSMMDFARILSQRHQEKLVFLQGALRIPAARLRHNQTWTHHWMSWKWEGSALQLSMKGHWTESVFGEKLTERQTFDWMLPVEKGVFRLNLPPQIQGFLERREQSLSDTMPQVVLKDRAWAYLDKGRAWGLRLKDRIQIQGGEIKGHVVGFYGPRSGVRRGDEVMYEGAIVYIRKGQHLVQPGMAIEWERVAYPTPWK